MNYGEIKTAIANRSHRTDLTSHLPQFVALAESEYNRRTDSSYDLTSGTDSTHNWLTDNAADVYIWGGLMQLAIWTGDDNALQKFTALFERALAQAQYAEVRESGVMDEPMETELPLVTGSNILEGTP
jgi:hypothetical protein